MQGDKLASGSISAQFAMPKVTQEKWDAIWAEEPVKEEKSSEEKHNESKRQKAR